MKASWALFVTSLHGLLGVAAALPQHPTDSTYENGESRPGKSLNGRADEISVAQAEQDFVAALSISGYDMSTFAGNVTHLATRLVNWDGCDAADRRMIYAGWQQSWKIMNLVYKEANSINFNEASAVEYLGPPSLNQNQQGAIRDIHANTDVVAHIFRNLATIQPGYITTPFDWQLHVRCDDPKDKCPCGGGSTVHAYTTNRDPSSGLARINFCPLYFGSLDLDFMMEHGGDKSLGEDWWTDLENYIPNKARTWIHELLHIDWVSKAGEYGSNRHVTDVQLLVQTRPSKNAPIILKILKAYDPALVKSLARWGKETGGWVVQNSDSLTLYAMARYVQKALGNIYPHLPLAPSPPKGVSTSSNGGNDVVIGDLFAFQDDGTATIINSAAVDALSWQADDSCGLDEDFTTDAAVTLGDGFAPASSFPSAYLDQYNSWNLGPQIAIASYINPLGDPAAWARLLAYETQKVSVLVANVLNGPDYIVDPAWKSVIDQAASSGKKIIGYVRTGYLGVSQQKFTTRLGSNDLADWTSQIEQDIDKWYELYGVSIGGIFFDEGWPECGFDNIYADLYAHINNYTKRKYPGAFTVLNPGSPIAQCYEDTMDALMTFENSYEAYQNSYVPNDWTPKDPRKIWHIIYRVPEDQIANVAALAWSRHAGLLEITDDDNPNPYDNLPNDAYMQAVMSAVPGGKPRISDPAQVSGTYVAGFPNDAAVVSSDYSSVTLSWTGGVDSRGYAVYLNGKLILELPGGMTRATVGMLDPGSSDLIFEVRTRMTNIGEDGESRFITASTKSLPNYGAISNGSVRRDGVSLVVTVDVLIPYAFVRLFIRSGGDNAITTKKNGWPINLLWKYSGDSWVEYKVGVYDYLVEGNDFYSGLYSYTGNWHRDSTANADWSWTPAADVVVRQTQSGYTYTWILTPWSASNPLGDIPAGVAVQCQGYAPLANVAQ